ncbi:biotin--[acetyl-CoA-carboxylase] ligase, partial [Streptomyces carpinensis]
MTPRDAADNSPENPGDSSGGGRWSDLDRPPLNAGALRRGLVREGGLWSQ